MDLKENKKKNSKELRHLQSTLIIMILPSKNQKVEQKLRGKIIFYYTV